jgi:hypothetical protein
VLGNPTELLKLMIPPPKPKPLLPPPLASPPTALFPVTVLSARVPETKKNSIPPP